MALCGRLRTLRRGILRCAATHKPVASQRLATLGIQRNARNFGAASPGDQLRMLRAVEARPAGFELPGAFYLDNSFFMADAENLWQTQWTFAGHDCKLTSKKDTITMQIAQHPISIVRGGDGNLNAFCKGTAESGLKPIAVESDAGHIFVSLAEEPQPFKPLGTSLESYLTMMSL